ncbi:hypothetical protein P9213_14080, partial [Geobacillus stearothermophilus]|uniref:hypothetical protein n=1 Tax=Geobacillus stearothermophilus TaxID=1422 RepID=UPI002E24B6A8|nr:hypothetical protein [Geobacillus stearothermophilus]
MGNFIPAILGILSSALTSRNKNENGGILLLNLGSICSKMKVLLHGDSPFEWQVALSFYRRSASKGYFYACSSLSSTT